MSLNIFVFAILIHLHGLVHSYEIETTDDAMEYLARFGYVGEDTASSMNLLDAGEVIKAFQHMGGLNETGILDEPTKELMNTPRCGNKDLVAEVIPDPPTDSNEIDSKSGREKRWKVSKPGVKWTKGDLTYKIGRFSSRTDLPNHLIERDVDHAFRIWAGVTNLNFIKRPDSEVDIELGFASSKHHDEFPFDGPGKTLAHAFGPGGSGRSGRGLSGDVHFDDHETWTVDSPKGTNLLFVAVHEIGHALGLSHSDKKGAIMQAFYGGYRPHLKLHPDDVAGIQSLYGEKVISPPPSPSTPNFSTRLFSNPNPPPSQGQRQRPEFRPSLTSNSRRVMGPYTIPRPGGFSPRLFPSADTMPDTTTTTSTTTVRTPTPFSRFNQDPVFGSTSPRPKVDWVGEGSSSSLRPDLCRDIGIDATTTLGDRDNGIYVFKGSYVFRINEDGSGVQPNWPRKIEFTFPGLEPNIDAAFSLENGNTYFFKGGKFWRFSGLRMDPGYPKTISRHFPRIPNFIDSAFVYPLNNQIYFTKGDLKGDKYWRFDPLAKTGAHVSDIYPLSLESWGLPISGVQAALSTSSGDLYFFQDDNYWKFDHRKFSVSRENPPYPRSSRRKWFGCSI